MEYLAVRCVDCRKEFAVERIDDRSQAIHFQRASFRASYTCPHCDAAHDYGFEDLMPFDGGVPLQPQGLDPGSHFRKRW